MKAFTTDLGLSLQARKVKVGELLELGILACYHHPLYRLGQQKLVVKRDEGTFILERKNNPNSHVNVGLEKKIEPNPQKMYCADS